ncbi:MAG: hypothetical protein ACPL1D_02940, partial [Microgenomates group bacterium]
YSQRTKEEAHDYRYFPEPDIPPIVIDKFWLDRLSKQIPELPDRKLKRYLNDFKLRFEEAFNLTRDKNTAQYYERVIDNLKNKISGKQVGNLNQYVANLIVNKKVNLKLSIADFTKKVIELLKPKNIDENLVNKLIEEAISQNPKAVVDYKKGKKNAIMFLVGQILKKLNGKADAKVIIEKLKEKINKS